MTAYKYAFSAMALMLPLAAAAKTSSRANVCYTEYREEMVTASLFTAKQQGLFAQKGVDLRLIEGDKLSKPQRRQTLENSNFDTSSPKSFFNNSVNEVGLLQAADQKKCDFISTTFEAVLASKMNLKEYVPVAVYQYGKNYDTHLVVRKDSNIQSIKDLKGKVVRYNQIGSLIPFENLLEKAGLDITDVKFERSQFLAVADELDQKKIDAVLSYNPTIPLLLGSGRVRILQKNLFENFYQTPVPHSLLLVKKEFMTKNAETYSNFMAAFQAASDEIVKKPEQIVNVIPDVKKKYSAPDIEKSLAFIQVGHPLLAINMTPKKFFTEGQFTAYARILKDHGFIADPVDLSAWIY